ncbi:hypothetical protein HYV11_03445 [Candidatus Dependentiae bacterium]|nr:hypothetical protein [Candidatus Dependentiae bacterium]
MKFIKKSIILIILSVVTEIKTTTISQLPNQNITPTKKSLPSGIIFQGVTENNIKRNTFLCKKTDQDSDSVNFESESCNFNTIQTAIGFSFSEGDMLQFFNNTIYWLEQRKQKERYYKLSENIKDDELNNKLSADGFVAMGVYSILLTTNPTLQKIITPEKTANSNQIKLIVQLLYNGNDLIQLWSQDVQILNKGQSFTIALTNDYDTTMQSTNQKASTTNQQEQFFLPAMSNFMQKHNRNESTYQGAKYSPRMVRIIVQN